MCVSVWILFLILPIKFFCRRVVSRVGRWHSVVVWCHASSAHKRPSFTPFLYPLVVIRMFHRFFFLSAPARASSEIECTYKHLKQTNKQPSCLPNSFNPFKRGGLSLGLPFWTLSRLQTRLKLRVDLNNKIKWTYCEYPKIYVLFFLQIMMTIPT